MHLLELFIGIALCGLLLSPLLKISGDLFIQQIKYEKVRLMTAEGERALELMGRAIRIAGYRNTKTTSIGGARKIFNNAIEIQKSSRYQGSDSLQVRHELSDGVDFDCIGNVLNSERTKGRLAFQGFVVNHQKNLAKDSMVNGSSLMCQSLDRQGRLQTTTLMNGVESLHIEELTSSSPSQRTFKIKLVMTDGPLLQRSFERTFSTRNLL
jgi:hypothetical protein